MGCVCELPEICFSAARSTDLNDPRTKCLEGGRSQTALGGQSQVGQRTQVQVPVSLGRISVQRDRVGPGQHRLLEHDIFYIAAGWSIANEHPVGVDDRQCRTDEIRKVNQAFVDALVELMPGATQNSVPVLHSQSCAREAVMLGDGNVDDLVGSQKRFQYRPILQYVSLQVDVFKSFGLRQYDLRAGE